MVRRNSSSPNASVNRQGNGTTDRREVDFDIQQELARLQEMIYESFHIPVSRWTIVDEDKLLEQLDLIGTKIPEAIRKALSVLEQEQDIIAEAEAYAERIVQSAQQRAAQILDESGIIQQAQREANQIRQQVQQECEAIQSQTMAEIEQLRQVTTSEMQQLRQQSMGEAQNIQDGADEYADAVLTRLEQQLSEMLGVVRNGRQQLYGNSPQRKATLPGKPLPSSVKKRPQ
ncbi:ATP synthase F0 subunit B [Crocosphaera sp. UHCC 0190]|uniref:ATP synthase F0 subunit B n=1 Tax=Crocosphaera sp. UHCC 0190 TaxID=3110246 RepID=UPI002B20C9D1|nr:ATP synthase F0 subunit B [Crocosphaera sp. UHCC 0190]MEA5512180.1 ATP synthase F0 subunit B [Crocosphaera sp. UHCC 0190]